MEDILILTASNPTEMGYYLDINIVDGKAQQVPPSKDFANNQLQRASIGALISKGTIPGFEDIGADWAAYLGGSKSLVDIDNQVKSNMESVSGTTNIENYPIPMYVKDEDGKLNVDVIYMTLEEGGLK